MKQTIHGRKYDTETAEALVGWGNGCYGHDPHRCYETLYRKGSGEFFLHGEGGAMSKYAQNLGNNQWQGEEVLIPLTYEAAKQWTAEKGTAEEYELIFGETQGKRKTITVTLAAEAAATLQSMAARDGSSLAECVEKLIRAAVEQSA